MASAAQRAIAAIRDMIRHLAARCVVADSDDAKKMQELKASVLAGELRDGVERFQEFGFTSRPPDGGEAVIVFLGGSRDHGVVVATDDRRYRLRNLAKGEVALYDDLGNYVRLFRDRIEVSGAKVKVIASDEADVVAPTIKASAAAGGTTSEARLDASGLRLETSTSGGNSYIQLQGGTVEIAATGSINWKKL